MIEFRAIQDGGAYPKAMRLSQGSKSSHWEVGMSSKQNKTAPTNVTVDEFLSTVSEQRQTESRVCIALMQEITGFPPLMWGPSIIGFGSYHYRYESGREGDAPIAGFSPRKANLVIYLTEDVAGDDDLLASLGPHTTSKVCLYINRLSAVDLDVLRKAIAASCHDVMAQYPTRPAE